MPEHGGKPSWVRRNAILKVIGGLTAALLVSALLQWAGISGAMLLGPLLAGLAMGVGGVRAGFPAVILHACQAMVGCYVAAALDARAVGFALTNPVSVLMVATTTLLSVLLMALCLIRFARLSPETAVWSAMPGAASTMVTLAAESGGDPRQVAVAQYLRLLFVIATASIVHSVLGDGVPTHTGAVRRAVETGQGGLTATIALILLATALASRFKLPGGPLFMAIAGTLALRTIGLPSAPPPWLMLTLGYAILGLTIGMRFDRAALVDACKRAPAIGGAIICMILLCALAGLGLSLLLPTNAMTGYLALTPGAIDSVAAIANDGHADMSVIFAMQTLRFFGLLLLAPLIVRLARRLMGRRFE